MARKKSLKQQVQKNLTEKLTLGQSKKQAKINKTTSNKIFSEETFRTYRKQCYYFVDWLRENHPETKDILEAENHVDEYLQQLIDLKRSAFTLSTIKSALLKLYGYTGHPERFITTPERHRADITRSRNKCVRDAHFSEANNRDYIQFCRSTGLRVGDIKKLKGKNIVLEGKEAFIDVRNSKGGKNRLVKVIGDVQFVIDLMQKAGDSKVFEKIHGSADTHSYRADYATAYYKSIARDISTLKRSEKYFCRGDKKGIVYDKVAMLEVSRMLGHNRIDVIAANYLY